MTPRRCGKPETKEEKRQPETAAAEIGTNTMAEKKALTMWALWNYSRVMGVKHSRRETREYAEYLHPDIAAELFKIGAFRITKVAVREI